MTLASSSEVRLAEVVVVELELSLPVAAGWGTAVPLLPLTSAFLVLLPHAPPTAIAITSTANANGHVAARPPDPFSPRITVIAAAP
jgi:hypothetical protein